MQNTVLVKNATIVTVDPQNRVFAGSIFIKNGVIHSLINQGEPLEQADLQIDASGCLVIPGFIQSHIHLAQHLIRGFAEDLPLLDWLKKFIWPFEAAHNAKSLSVSASLGLCELISSGTTAALDMGTVHYTSAIFEQAQALGFRLCSGKAMMDQNKFAPKKIIQSTQDSLDESVELAKKWHNNGLLKYAFAPRFLLSCSDKLMEGSAKEARNLGCLLHTHASESTLELKELKKGNIELLHERGFSGPDTVLAHCVHLSPKERELMQETGTKVAHCPSANLKLASGIADICDFLHRDIIVGLGSDGAPCNNRLDIFSEMRLSAMLQKLKYGARSMPAEQALKMATIWGAKLLGIDDLVGSIEIGKSADLAIIEQNDFHTRPIADPVTTLVYSATSSAVRDVLIDGHLVLKNRQIPKINKQDLFAQVESERALLFERI